MKFAEIRELFGITDRDGFAEGEIQKAVQTWGALPLALTDYYRELGANARVNRQQNFLVEPGKLFEQDDYLIFYLENQSAARWGIRREDLSADNPPVYCTAAEGTYELESDTLEEFLYAAALFQAASWGLRFPSEELYSISRQQAELIRQNYSPKPCGLRVWVSARFYGNHGDEVVMLMENDDYDMIYGSESEAHFQALEEFFGKMDLEAY